MNNKSTDKNNEKENIMIGPKVWNDTEVRLLKKWGEQSASYRVLHNKAYRKYKENIEK